MAGRYAKSFAYLSWHHIVGSLLDVYWENVRREEEGSPFKANADNWSINDTLRRDVHERACRYWCKRTGLDLTYFPLSVDAAARLYFRIRKRNEKEIKDMEAEVKEAGRAMNDSSSGLFASAD